MLATLKSEFKKFLSVRSTYIVTGFVLVLVTFFSIYVFGYQSAALTPDNPRFLYDTVYSSIGMFVTFGAILSILLVAHEYRYNMINYTLTASRSRLRVMVAKIIVMLCYATVIGIVVAAIGYFGAKFGVGLADKVLVPQDLPVLEMIWRLGLYVWGYILVGLIIALLIRGVVGSIVVFFLFPTAEQILSLLLKGNTKYLPFRSLESIAATGGSDLSLVSLTPTAAAGVFSLYLVVMLIVTAITFVKRDAS